MEDCLPSIIFSEKVIKWLKQKYQNNPESGSMIPSFLIILVEYYSKLYIKKNYKLYVYNTILRRKKLGLRKYCYD